MIFELKVDPSVRNITYRKIMPGKFLGSEANGRVLSHRRQLSSAWIEEELRLALT